MAMKLPLHQFEPPPQPCVRSGQCCKQSTCGYPGAVYDHEAKRCSLLQVDEQDAARGIETYRCGAYSIISEGERGSNIAMFHTGCCQPMFNRDRMKIITKKLALGCLDVDFAGPKG